MRLATSADVERLALINMLAWQHAYAGLVPDTYLQSLTIEKLRDRWVVRVTEPGDLVSLVAELDGVVASYAIVGGYRKQHDADAEDTSGWGELYALYAHPQLQGRGAGLAVHDAGLDVLAGRGFGVAALWVLRDNVRTRRWYGGRGWRADGALSWWSGAGAPLEEVRLVRGTNGSYPARSSRLGR